MIIINKNDTTFKVPLDIVWGNAYGTATVSLLTQDDAPLTDFAMTSIPVIFPTTNVVATVSVTTNPLPIGNYMLKFSIQTGASVKTSREEVRCEEEWAEHYTHTEPLPSALWTVNHGLNKKCSITVVDATDEVIYGDVTYIDDNTVQISFNSPQSGKVYCN